uniref:Uncharacterized protein n=1 Tax=Rhizophora mucronata TaxID=61149 RepID=A0A2P2PRA3_RHIMU
MHSRSGVGVCITIFILWCSAHNFDIH